MNNTICKSILTGEREICLLCLCLLSNILRLMFVILFILISAAKWDPCRARLAVCTGSNKLYLWSPDGCVAVEVPAEGETNG